MVFIYCYFFWRIFYGYTSLVCHRCGITVDNGGGGGGREVTEVPPIIRSHCIIQSASEFQNA
jgi:hypothetical protein